ncbi:MAG: glutamate--tRNA ligase [Anaerolineae bacterium]|nr:glutamate--tRNA ligase [Anaerolineae bacterium]
MSDPAVTRFAPSPTGPPHLGNLRTALFDWLLARATGGRFILRIDDTDRTRYDPNAIDQMLAALRWMGLEWDEGPDRGGPRGPYRQSARLTLYVRAAERLLDSGHAYFRKDEPKVVRLRLPQAGTIAFTDLLRGEIVFNVTDLPEDPVLIKSDGNPTYHLATIVDDQEMGITHILRGEEWIPSTPLHVYMIRALGYREPQYVHLSLVTDAQGQKIKKRDPSFEFRQYRESGFLPEALFNYLALLGWHPGSEDEVFTREELVERFDLARLSPGAAAFDEERLRWFNRQHLHRLDTRSLAGRVAPVLRQAYPAFDEQTGEWHEQLLAAIRDDLTTLADAVPAARFAFTHGDLTVEARAALAEEYVPLILQAFLDAVSVLGPLTVANSGEAFTDLRRRFKASHRLSGRAVMFPLRAALTGSVTGPHLAEVAALLGREECLHRVATTLDRLAIIEK